MSRLAPFLTIAILLLTSFSVFSYSAEESIEYAPTPSISGFAGGSGTESDPYQISNITQLQNMSSDLDAHYVLVNDIDASATSTWNWNGGNYEGFDPIGDYSNSFSGSLDGNDHTISDLNINRPTESRVGLVQTLVGGGDIRNIGLENITLSGSNYVGGLVGDNGGSISNCYSTGSISGSYCGGIIGRNDGTISTCHSGSNVNGGSRLGGLIGFNRANVNNCYATGSISGTMYVGGLTGINWGGTINNCYSTGSVTGTSDGGLNGYNSGTVSGSFWDTQSSGQTTSAGGTGKTTSQMMIKSTFTSAGWDFTDTWYMEESETYPLIGSPVMNYSIMNLQDLNNMRYNLTGNYILGADINASATATWNKIGNSFKGFKPIGNNVVKFSGSLDGEGHTISGLYINRTGEDYVGLFGYNTGDLSNIIMEDPIIMGNHNTGALVGMGYNYNMDEESIIHCGVINGTVKGSNSVGGLIGRNGGYPSLNYDQEGVIKYCFSTGSVEGEYFVGGLTGTNDALVEESYSEADAKGDLQVGGLIGSNYGGNAYNCYSRGDSNGNSAIGGLIGYNIYFSLTSPGEVKNCYSTGTPTGSSAVGGFMGTLSSGSISNCYWDTTSSGTTTGIGSGTSSGVTGKITSQMKTESSFTGAGWDFGSIWYILDGKDYPILGSFQINYTIMDLQDLHMMRYDMNGAFTLGSDINASATRTWNNGAGFLPIGDSPTRFGGTLDGNNFTISGLFINRPSTNGVGLFGFTTAGCNIHYVSLNDVNITGYSYVGALAGAHDISTIVRDSNSSGKVKGNNEVGGLFGRSYGLVERCFSSVEVEASNQAGGLIGVNLDGMVNNCFASGNVSGSYFLGGLVGRNRRISGPPIVTDSYATGNVSTGTSCGGLVGLNDAGSSVTGCFYDNITTGHSSGSPGTPKNTTDMKKWVTFSSAGWDLENIWNIMDGISYPFFGRFNVSYMIYDLQDLHNMRYDKTGDYKLATDIDASATKEWYWNGSAYNGFDPVGDNSNPFTGSFDGNSYTINGLHINLTTTTFVGLFGYIFSTSSVSNTTLKYVNITGKQYTGGLVGFNDGRIDNSSLEGSIFSDMNCGGISGYNRGNIDNCSTSGNISANGVTGGISGGSDKLIKNCKSTANVSSPVRPGGIVGYISGGSIVTNCTFNGNVTGNYWTGGVVGYNMGGSIDNCNSSGYVNGGDQYTGGLVGVNYGSLKYSFSTSSVNGTDRVGGAVGYNEAPAGSIDHCHSEGDVNGTNYVGGLVGVSGDIVENSYSISKVHATGSSVGGLIGSNTGDVNNSFSNNKVTGEGQSVGGFVGHTRLAEIVYCYSRSNTTGESGRAGGFAGYNDHSIISNCFSEGHVKSDDNMAGGFIGMNSGGTVSSCFSTGNSTSSSSCVGGFVGSNVGGTIIDCYSTGNSSGNANVGGFAGDNYYDPISNCYSTGIPAGNNDIGGFCGRNYGSNIVSCFFDNITSGMVTSSGGAGKNTSEMMLKSTFSNSGWDFNGVWEIVSTYTYPYLQNHSYNGPEIVTEHDTTATEDSLYKIDYEAVSDYPGNNMFQWTIVTSADWLSISLDGTLSGTPDNDDVGETIVKVICSLPTVGQTSSIFTLTIENTNDAPMITSTPDGNATEDLLYSTHFVASDIDPTDDTFTWSVEKGPDWISIDSESGWLNGTPLNGDVGTHDVNISVSDGNGGSDWIRFTITVENTNDDPVITTVPLSTTIEDSHYSIYLDADDIDPVSTSFTWSLKTDASWLSLTGNHLRGTPKNSDVGSYWVNVSVNDGYGGSDWENFTLTVINTNDAPLFTFTPLTSILEDQFYALKTTAFDPDPTSDTLGWYLENGPGWLSLDANNGWLNGTPLNNDVGSYQINVSVRDGNGGHDFMEFLLKVINVNDDPMIMSSAPPESVMEDSVYSMDFSGIDIDPVPTIFEWSLETNASWLTLDESHLHGIPTNDDVGLYLVNITLKDGDGGSDWREFTVEVINTNDDPYFTVDPLGFVSEDHEYNITLDAEDPDPTYDKLTWHLMDAPGFLSLDPETGRLRGIPANAYVGTWNIIATVSDGNDGLATIEFQIIVENTNDDPIIITEPITEIQEDEEYFLRLVAADEDPGENEIQWEMRTNATWLSLYGDTLKGTPSDDEVGSFFVNITIDDGYGGYDQLYFIINVTNTNDPPIIISDPVFFAIEDELYTMQPNVRDADIGDSFQWTMTGPEWLNMDPNTGLINGTPTNDDVGQYWIKITVTDLEGELDSISFMLEVQNINDAPEWDCVLYDRNMTEEDLLTIYAKAIDVDGDTLTYSISSNPELEITINPDTGMILCNIPKAGSYAITVTATDGIETIDTVFHINVSKVPEVIITTKDTDTDSDGMPDWWEDLYDLDPEDPSDAVEDLDGDGIRNLEEFNGLTSPTEDNSEPEENGTSPVFFIIIALLAILALVFLVLFVTKGGKGTSTDEIPSQEISKDIDGSEPISNDKEIEPVNDEGAMPPEMEDQPLKEMEQ